MRIFHYNSETGVFGGEDVADESPLEEGVWLIPAHATTEPPPPVGDGEQAVWKGAAWAVEPIPEPEPEPEPELPLAPAPLPALTLEEKLAAAGISLDELREALLA